MVLVRERRAEEREDAITSGLHDVAVVAPRRFDHDLQRRVDNRACFFRIEVLLKLRGTLDVREQCGDCLTFTVERFR